MTDIVRSVLMTVELSRSYGRDTVKFGISEAVSIASGMDRREKYAGLLAQMHDQIEMFEREHSKMLSSHPANDPVTGTGTQLVRIPITSIIHENADGKERFKVKGGQFEKFGVQLYTDMKNFPDDFNPFELPYGAHDMTGKELGMVCEVVAGKPKRVTSLYWIKE